jgi:hypothetical protein
MAHNTPSVEQILESEGPLLSSRLCGMLEARGLSNVAARQRISRANDEFDDVKRLQGLFFLAAFVFSTTSPRSVPTSTGTL